MGLIGELGLLLLKNIRLRLRSPLLTIALFFWPILIFVILALIRNRLPPEQRTECYYNPQALPSVGTVEFMQSMMCDIQTECRAEDEVPKTNEKPVYGASLGLIIDDLAPVFQNETILEDLQALPDTLEPLLNLTNTLEEIVDYFDEQEIYLKGFFQNETKLRQNLLEHFPEDFINPMLDAKINILEVLNVAGYSGAESVFCNVSTLETFLIFPGGTDVEAIASALCQLDRDMIEDIVRIVLEELDVQYIADEIDGFIAVVEKYGLDNFTRDVMDIQNQLRNLVGLEGLDEILPQIIELSALIPDLQRFIEAVPEGGFDELLILIRDLVDALEWENAPDWWPEFQETLYSVIDLISAVMDLVGDVQDGDISFNRLFGDSPAFQNLLGRFNISEEAVGGLLNGTFPYDRLSGILELFTNPDGIVDAYCHGNKTLEEMVSLSVPLDEEALKRALCSGNGTALFDAILGEIDIGNLLKELLNSPQSFNLTAGIGPLLNKTQEIINQFRALPNFLREIPAILASFNGSQLAPLLDLMQLFQNGTEPADFIPFFVDMAAMLEGLFTQTDWYPELQRQFAYQMLFADAAIATFQRLEDGALIDAFNEDPYQELGSILLMLGPNVTEAVLKTFLDSKKIEELYAMPPKDQVLVLCTDFIEYPPDIDDEYVKEVLCQFNLTEIHLAQLEVWAKHFPEVMYAIEVASVLLGDISAIPPEYLVNATFKNVIYKQIEVQAALDAWIVSSHQVFEEFFASFELNITGTTDEWIGMLLGLQADLIPSISTPPFLDELQTALSVMADYPLVQNAIASQAIQDVILQDLNEVLYLFITLSNGDVPPYGGETEKFLTGVVFITQQGGAIQAAIAKAYEDPTKIAALATVDQASLLCNATVRDSLLDLSSLNTTVLDDTLCSVDYVLLGYEMAELMQIEYLEYLFEYLFMPAEFRNDTIDFNLTAMAEHANEFAALLEHVGPAWNNWVEIFSDPAWMSLVSEFPMDWTSMFESLHFSNLTALLANMDPSSLVDLTKMFEGALIEMPWWPDVQRQLAFQLLVLDTEILVFEKIEDGALIDAFAEDPYQQFARVIFYLGPNVTEAIFTTFINQQKLEELFALPPEEQALVFCSDFIEYPPEVDNAHVKELLCQFNLTQLYLVQQEIWAENFPEIAEAIEIGMVLLLTPDVTEIPPEYLANATFSNVIAKQIEFQAALENWMVGAPTFLTELFVALEFNVTGTTEEWVAMLGRLQEEASPFPSTLPFDDISAVLQNMDLQNITLLLEGLIESLAPNTMDFIHRGVALQNTINSGVEGINNLYDLIEGLSIGEIIVPVQGMEIEKLLQAYLGQDPFAVHQAMWEVSQNQEARALLAAGLPDWTMILCNATVRDAFWGLPRDGIDTALIDQTFCTIDWDVVGEEMVSFLRVDDIIFWFSEYVTPSGQAKLSDVDWSAQTANIETLISNMANLPQVVDNFVATYGFCNNLECVAQYFERLGNYNWQTIMNEQLTLVLEGLSSQLSDIPGWETYKSNVYLVFRIIEDITAPDGSGITLFTLGDLVPNATEFAVILSQMTNLPEEAVSELLAAQIDLNMIIDFFSANSWDEVLCSEELLSLVFIQPEGLNITQLQGALCGIDFEDLIAQLSQGAGIDQLINMIIEHIRTFNAGDDFGIGDFDPAKWASQLDQLLQSFDMQNIQGFIQALTDELLASFDDIDRLLVNVTLWNDLKSDLGIILTILQSTSDYLGNGTNIGPISFSSLVPNVTEFAELLAETTDLSPENIDALLYSAIDPSVLLEMVFAGNWNETLCSADHLRALFVTPDALNLTEIQRALCGVDFQKSLVEVLSDDAFQVIINVIIDTLYQSITPGFTVPGINFEEIIAQVFSAIQNLDFESLSSLDGLGALFVNESWYQQTLKQLQFQNFVTKVFTDKIIMLEGQQIVYPFLGNLLVNSSQLLEILQDDLRLAPGLLEAMLTLSLSPDKAVEFFNMTNPLASLCVNGQFASFFYSPLNPDFDLATLEQAFCSVDLDALTLELKELVSFDEIAAEFAKFIDPSVQATPLNWTATYLIQARSSQAVESLIANPPSLSFDEAWINDTLKELVEFSERWSAVQEWLNQGVVPTDIENSLASLSLLLQSGVMANESWAIELDSALRTMNALLEHINQKILPLPGQNITLHDLLPPDIATYLEDNSGLSPDIMALLLHASVHTTALLASNVTWLESVCLHVDNLPLLIDFPEDVDLAAAQEALCALDLNAWEIAYIQEMEKLVAAIESGEPANLTAINENLQRLAAGITDLVQYPPTLLKYNEEWFETTWTRIVTVLEATSNYTMSSYADPMQISDLIMQQWAQLQQMLAASDPSLLAQFRLIDYITSVLIDMLQMLPGQTYTLPKLEELFGDTTHVRQLLGHADIAPEIIDVFMSLAVEQEKLMYLFNTSDAFVKLCASGEFAGFFTLPPDSPTDVTVVEEAICSTNLTLVLAELDEKFKYTQIASEIQRILDNDPTLPPYNSTAASLRTAQLSDLIMTLIQNPPTVTVDPEWWTDFTNRSQVIVFQWLERLQEQNLNDGMVPNFDSILEQLRAIPGFGEYIDTWLLQNGFQQYIQSVIETWIASSNGTITTLPTFEELFPDPSVIVHFLNQSGVPQEIIDGFLLMSPQIDQWMNIFNAEDPLTAICNTSLFQDVFELTGSSLNASLDTEAIQIIQAHICSLDLTSIDAILSQLFMSDEILMQLTQIFYQMPDTNLELALNLSRLTSKLISDIVSGVSPENLDYTSIIKELRTIPGLGEYIDDWLVQNELQQYIQSVILDWILSSNGTITSLPTFEELFPDPNIIRDLLLQFGLPTEIVEGFLQMAPQIDQWTNLFSSPDPLSTICNTSLFQDVFELTGSSLNASLDTEAIQIIQAYICSLDLTSIDAILSQLFMSDEILMQLTQIFYQMPDTNLELALNLSRLTSKLISDIISGVSPENLDYTSIIKELRTIPGLGEYIDDWLVQNELQQYIQSVILDWILNSNGTITSLPTFEELFPDPNIIRDLLLQLGLPTDIVEGFLQMAPQIDQWTNLFSNPDPLSTICNTSLFQDVFELTGSSLNASLDTEAIQIIQAHICSLDLTSIDAILSQLFMSDEILTQLTQIFYQMPDTNLELALNLSRLTSKLISDILSGVSPENLDYTSIIKELRTIPGLGEYIDDWLVQNELQQYIQSVILDWILNSNGSITSLPTFEELFPDPNVIRDLLLQLGLPAEIVEGFLQMAPQIDQWTNLFSNPDPLSTICNTSLFQDIFELTGSSLNASLDTEAIQIIQAHICSLDLTSIDAILSQLFMPDDLILKLTQLFYQEPDFDLTAALNLSRYVSDLINGLISDPSQVTPDYQKIVELLQALEVPGLDEAWVQDWLGQVQLMDYISNIVTELLTGSNGTALTLPTFEELFPDPDVLRNLFAEAGIPADITETFLQMAVQADQWNELWMSPDPLQSVCESSLFQDVFTQAGLNATEYQVIQDLVCNANLTYIDIILTALFNTDPIIIQISKLLFNDPAMDWTAALNLSKHFSETFDKLFANPPHTDEDIVKLTGDILKGVENMLEMYGVWDVVEPHLQVFKLLLESASFNLNITTNVLFDIFNPSVPLTQLVDYLGKTPDEILVMILTNIENIEHLAGIYLGGYWDDNFYCDNDDLFYFIFNQTDDGLLNRTAIREAFCSLDVAEFFETAKDVYGIDFLELTKLLYNQYPNQTTTPLDVYALVEAAYDMVQVITDLIALPAELTEGIDVDFLIQRLTNLTSSLQAQNFEQLLVVIDELAPFFNDPEIAEQVKMALMSGSELMDWWNTEGTINPVAWLETIQGVLTETGLWNEVLPILTYADTILQGVFDQHTSNLYKLPLLLTNETVLQTYLTEMLHLAPEYAQAITLSSFADIFRLINIHLDGEWEAVFCEAPSNASKLMAPDDPTLNQTAIHALLCTLNRTQFFDYYSQLIGQDIVELSMKLRELQDPSYQWDFSELYDWDTLVGNVQSIVDAYSSLFSLGDLHPNLNSSFLHDLAQQLQMGLQEFNMEVLIEQLELLDKVFVSHEWESFQGYMNTITNIVELLNDQFEIALAHNVTITELFAHSQAAELSLSTALGSELYFYLVTSTVDQELAVTLDTHSKVETSICDPDSFNQLFTPLEGLDSSNLHSTLCELAKSDHPTFANDLMVHFNNAPLQEEVVVLATDNHGHGFHDQEMDVRRMEAAMEELVNNIILSVLDSEYGVSLDLLNVLLTSLTGSAVDLAVPTEFDIRSMLEMVSPSLLPLIPWDNMLRPTLGRIDLLLRMVDDLYFTLPEREDEIQAILDNETIVNEALPIILEELPTVLMSWESITADTDIFVVGKLLIELLQGDLAGISNDTALLETFLASLNATATETEMDDFIVSLDRMLQTELGQQLLEVFRIKENAERWSDITDSSSTDVYTLPDDLLTNAYDVTEKIVMCVTNTWTCPTLDLQPPASFEVLFQLGEIFAQLPTGDLDGLGDMLIALEPLLESILEQTDNGTQELVQGLTSALGYLHQIYEANKDGQIELLPISDLPYAFFNSSELNYLYRLAETLEDLDIDTLKEGFINTTVLFELLNYHLDDLVEGFCDYDLFADLIVGVAPDTIDVLREVMCVNGSFNFELVLGHLDLENLIAMLTFKARETFPEFLLSVVDAVSEVEGIDYQLLGEYLASVILPLFDDGLPSLTELSALGADLNQTSGALTSLDRLMTALDPLMGQFEGFSDFHRLIQTLLDDVYIFEFLAALPDLAFDQLLEDEERLKDYLHYEAGFPRMAALHLTQASLNIENLLLSDISDFLPQLCDPEYLDVLLMFPNQTNVTVLADTMCGLNSAEIATLFEVIIPFIDVPHIMDLSLMDGNYSNLFSISNKTISDVMQSLDSLDSITQAFSVLENAFGSLSDQPVLEMLNELGGMEYLTGDELSEVTQEIMCGSNSTSNRRRRSIDELNNERHRSKRATDPEDNGDFCMNIFSSVIPDVDPRLVWAYIKPIIQGSILYTPNTPLVQALIQEVNSTFDEIAQTKHLAELWLSSGDTLSDLTDTSSLDSAMILLDNSYVSGLLEAEYDLSTDYISSLLNGNLSSISNEDVQTINTFAELLVNLTNCFNLNRFEGFDSESALVNEAKNLDRENVLLAGLVFDIPRGATELPHHVKYKIRMDTDNTPPTDRQQDRYEVRGPRDNFVFDLRYMRGFVMLQDMVEKSIISLQAHPDTSPPGVYLQFMPYPCYLGDSFGTVIALILPLIMTVGFVILIGVMTHQLVYEKERGIEELFKVMGLRGGVNWWAWLILNWFLLIILALVVVVIVKVGYLLPLVDWSLLLVLLLDNFFAITMFSYMASALFQRANMAALASILVYIMFYLPYLAAFVSQSLQDTLWKPIVLGIFCPSTFSMGCALLNHYEVSGEGAHWGNLWEQPMDGQITSVALILILLAADGALYFLLGWYIKTLFPGKYGVPRPWYFPLQPSYWCRCNNSRKRDMSAYINYAFDPESGVAVTTKGSVVEEEPSSHRLGVAILNLTKSYSGLCGDEKIAVDNLTLNFFEDQVTVVLGQNGAGKTSTINIITGLFAASSGKVYVHGRNIANKARVSRKNMGVCVQHNALYDELTVREHMTMAGRVKGLTGSKLDADMHDLLEDVGLIHQSEQRVKNLSGGMKRKLSVAMAFVGNSSIVILDEPTSGVDPHARRAIWNLILKNKSGRTIILCTHFMDEADILGDRIALLDSGHLRCCGSPGFLKTRFSSGYRLSLTKEAPSGASTPDSQRKRVEEATSGHVATAEPNIYGTMKSQDSGNPGSSSSGVDSDPGTLCDTHQVTAFIQSRIQTAKLQDDIGTELIYSLPVSGGEREKFQQLFEDLDASLPMLHVKSYGISDTTLKEVFLKVSTERAVDGATAPLLSQDNWSMREPHNQFHYAFGMSNALLNVWGMLIKRLHFVRRDWRGFIWTIFMPILMVALTIGFAQLSHVDQEFKLQLTPPIFNDPNSYVFFSDESESGMGMRMKDALLDPPGLGTSCMADAEQMDLYPCIAQNASLPPILSDAHGDALAEVPPDVCRCTATGFGLECDPEAGGAQPHSLKTDSLVTLQDITPKEDKSRYLIDTAYRYRDSRFGGLSWFDEEIDNETVTYAKAWFNNRAYHSMPTFLNTMNNIILRASVADNASEYGITAYNHPMELSKQDLGTEVWLQASEIFGIVFIMVAAFALIPAAFSMFLIIEHVNGSKRLHYVSGVGTFTYWFTNLLWDMFKYCIPVGLVLIVLKIFEYSAFISLANIGACVVLLFLYGFAMMCQLYVVVPFFKDAGTAFIIFFCFILLSAVVTNLPNWLMAVDVLSESEQDILQIVNYVLLVFTPFCFSSGLLNLIQNQATADVYAAFGVEDGFYAEPFQLLKWNMVALAVEGGVAFIIVLIVDSVRNSHINNCCDPEVSTQEKLLDNPDVLEERQRVLGGGSNNDLITLAKVRKVYRAPGKQNIEAVKDMCLGVGKGECFGLLGVNGAGKTSTFRMITEDLSPTDGVIKTRARSIGYCPQENAMYPQLTGEELLYCYARIKGISGGDIKRAVNDITSELGMARYVKKRISTYSGGMKRSLAVAVSLLGKPELVLMDEPTTGMDPITKQRVLNSLVNVVKDNRSVILTSHSMEECESVCTRLAIMVNGQFHCMGSPQHVKNRHGNGYSLVIRGQRSNKADMELIIEFVHRTFPGAALKEHHHNMVRFQLPPHNVTVATIFGVMEREKDNLHLEDYSISQTTLDEVFVNFAKRQTDGLEEDSASTTSAQEVVNRAFEPDADLDVDYAMPKNGTALSTRL